MSIITKCVIFKVNVKHQAGSIYYGIVTFDQNKFPYPHRKHFL